MNHGGCLVLGGAAGPCGQSLPASSCVWLPMHNTKKRAGNGYQMEGCVYKQRHVLDNQKQPSGSLYIKPRFNNSTCSLTQKKEGSRAFVYS